MKRRWSGVGSDKTDQFRSPDRAAGRESSQDSLRGGKITGKGQKVCEIAEGLRVSDVGLNLVILIGWVVGEPKWYNDHGPKVVFTVALREEGTGQRFYVEGLGTPRVREAMPLADGCRVLVLGSLWSRRSRFGIQAEHILSLEGVDGGTLDCWKYLLVEKIGISLVLEADFA